MQYDLAVIGGGAAGLAAAVAASGNGEHVIVLEALDAIGKKILASGNGRCNLMNTGELRYYGDSDFACKVLKNCDVPAQKSFWYNIGLITAEETDNRVYPCTFQAASVLQVLKTALRINNAETVMNMPVSACGKRPDGSFSVTAGGKTILARRILVAAGGPAGRRNGEGTSGYDILRRFGHTIFPIRPALVPMITNQKSISGLSGVRVRCSIALFNKHKSALHRETGELLFTDSGISGICVMQCARFVEGEGYYIEADFAGRLFNDDSILLDELRRRKEIFRNMAPEALLIGMLNIKLAYAVMKQAGAVMKGEQLKDLDEDFLKEVVRAVRHYRIEILRTRGMEDAQVTAGGADCREFNPDNMESRMVSGLYAAGEILNADGDCGGFNLMFAFGSGILAGMNGCVKKTD